MPGFSSPKSPLTTAVFLYDEHVLNLAPTVSFLQLSTENKQGNKKRKKTGLAKSFNLYILQYHFQHLSTARSSVLHWLLSPILSSPTKEGSTGGIFAQAGFSYPGSHRRVTSRGFVTEGAVTGRDKYSHCLPRHPPASSRPIFF